MLTWFLVIGLFLPRVALLASVFDGSVPNNDVPLGLDIVAAIVAPRLLIAYYTWYNDEHILWTILYGLTFIAMALSQRVVVRKR